MKLLTKIIERLYVKYVSKTYFDKAYDLAKELADVKVQLSMIARDYAIEINENASNQIEADIFQQALTNTFSEDEINRFFDSADKIRMEHEKNSK